MGNEDKEEKTKPKMFKYQLDEVREENLNRLKEVFHKRTISSALDHIISIAISDPTKFDFISSKISDADEEKRFYELNEITLQNKLYVDRIKTLEDKVDTLTSNVAEIKSLLAIGIPAVRNHIKNKDEEDFFTKKDKEGF